jgi:hypothetical protein
MELSIERGARYEYRDTLTSLGFYSASQLLAVVSNDYEGIPAAIMRRAAWRGTELHYLFAMLQYARKGVADFPERPEGELAGYFDAMVKFCDEWNPDPILIEFPSIFLPYRIAGTPDFLGLVGKPARRILTLIDLKSTAAKHRSHRVQLAIYRKLTGYEGAKELRVLYVHEDGSYEFVRVVPDPADEAVIIHAINLLNDPTNEEAAMNIIQWRQLAA